jgi:hypothetical protein
LERHLKAFIESLDRKASSRHTQSSYEIDLRQFAEFLALKKTAVEAVDHVVIRDLLNDLYTARKLSKSSVSRKLACLKTFFKFRFARACSVQPRRIDLIAALAEGAAVLLGEVEAASMVELPQGDGLSAFVIGRCWNCSMRAGFESASSWGSTTISST